MTNKRCPRCGKSEHSGACKFDKALISVIEDQSKKIKENGVDIKSIKDKAKS